MNTSFAIRPNHINSQDDKFIKKLEKLDLRPIVFKLVKDPDSGIPWTENNAKAVEIEYRQYLFLCWKYKKNPEISVSPTKRVDMFWHQHILDTEKYQEDCELLFATKLQLIISKCLRTILKPLGINIYSGYLQHFPYLGLRGEQDADNLNKAFEKGKELLALHFSDSN